MESASSNILQEASSLSWLFFTSQLSIAILAINGSNKFKPNDVLPPTQQISNTRYVRKIQKPNIMTGSDCALIIMDCIKMHGIMSPKSKNYLVSSYA